MIDKQIMLNLIDKAASNLHETGKLQNRSLLLLMILTILLNGLLRGLVSFKNDIELSGIDITLQSWVILLVVSWILMLAYLKYIGLVFHEDYLSKEIKRIYKTLGIEDESILKKGSFIEYPTDIFLLVTLISSGKNKLMSIINIFYMIIILFIILLLPILTEILVIQTYVLFLAQSKNFIVGFLFMFCIISDGISRYFINQKVNSRRIKIITSKPLPPQLTYKSTNMIRRSAAAAANNISAGIY